MSELIGLIKAVAPILVPVLISIGYMRGRLNGLVDQVSGIRDLEKRVTALEVENAKCAARREAETE